MENLQLADELARELKLQKLIEELVHHRISINPNYFDTTLTADLRDELIALTEQDRLRAAHIGKAQQRTRVRDIRGDSIHWLNGTSEAQHRFLDEMSTLRNALNQQLFMGLVDLEAHFAHYPPGSRYRKHLDSFQNNNLRRISVVTYLNPDWLPGDGGELEIFNGKTVVNRIAPLNGTLICFLSEAIPHQVTLTQRERFSIAGWFRVRDTAGLPPT